ncbi:unnamed protein product [Rotaria sp. Silwood1]|nr:unnamed protein product [Rotaria sp. Silwood1]
MKNCSQLIDPVHRAQYRHSNLPDYLIPCRYQDNCYEKSPSHRKKYFHGETLPSIKKNNTLTKMHSGDAAKTHLTPCRYGNQCRVMNNQEHISKYSHPNS